MPSAHFINLIVLDKCRPLSLTSLGYCRASTGFWMSQTKIQEVETSNIVLEDEL